MEQTLERRCAEQAQYFLERASLTALQCELVMFALSCHAPEVIRVLAEGCDITEMRLAVEFDDNPKPFCDDRGRTVRLHEYPGFGTAREVYSQRSARWYHEAWVK